MNTYSTPTRKFCFSAALTLAALLGALGLSSCTKSTREAYGCNTKVTIGYTKPVKLSDFAQDTNPLGTYWKDWEQLIIERNHLYTDTLKPGKKVQLPLPCKKV